MCLQLRCQVEPTVFSHFIFYVCSLSWEIVWLSQHRVYKAILFLTALIANSELFVFFVKCNTKLPNLHYNTFDGFCAKSSRKYIKLVPKYTWKIKLHAASIDDKNYLTDFDSK